MSDEPTTPPTVEVTIATSEATVTVKAPEPLAVVAAAARREHGVASRRPRPPSRVLGFDR